MNNRKDKMIEEYIHDPYFNKEKLEEPSVCEVCNNQNHLRTYSKTHRRSCTQSL